MTAPPISAALSVVCSSIIGREVVGKGDREAVEFSMGDGDGRAVAPISVREAAMAIPAAVSEVPTEHFVRDIGAAWRARRPTTMGIS